jgi:DNA-binding beta-propeller fold protein YncE
MGLTTVGTNPQNVKSDGADIWVTNFTSGTVSRVRASDGKKLDDWTGATMAEGVLVAMGRVFITGETTPAGHLYMIDPTGAAGAVTTLASNLGDSPIGIAFDGVKIWTANSGGVSIVTPGTTTPWGVSTKTTGFNRPSGLVFDGSNVWVTDFLANTLLKLDSNGNILTTVNVGSNPDRPAFDGRNIWVPNSGEPPSLTVVRASDGTVLKTFSAANGNLNGLNAPLSAAFDGQRILVTNAGGGVSLFKATDLSIIGTRPTPGVSLPDGACSDGVNFWMAFNNSGKIGRF